MSIVLTDNTNYTNIANAIRTKGVSGTFMPSEMANAILNIPSGSTGLWCGGDNPVLVYDDTYAFSTTLADMGYPDKTISTTSQTVKAVGALLNKQLPVTYNDIENYDFVCISYIEYHIAYTTEPTRRVVKGGQVCVQNLWQSQEDGTKASSQACLANVMYRTDANGNPMQFTDNLYVCKFSATPWSTLSNKNHIIYRSPAISVQAHATYMPVDSFNCIDYADSTYEQHAKIYRVDKNTSHVGKSAHNLIDRLNEVI